MQHEFNTQPVEIAASEDAPDRWEVFVPLYRERRFSTRDRSGAAMWTTVSRWIDRRLAPTTLRDFFGATKDPMAKLERMIEIWRSVRSAHTAASYWGYLRAALMWAADRGMVELPGRLPGGPTTADSPGPTKGRPITTE